MTGRMAGFTLIDDTPKLVLTTVLGLLGVLGVWIALDGHSASARAIRDAWSVRTTRLLAVLLAATVFAVVAEDVLDREQDQALLRLDRRARDALRHASLVPGVRASAAVASRLTGEGLAVAVVGTALALTAVRRRREAATLVLGTLTAWVASGALKSVFAVPRPRTNDPWGAFVSYGFPSGHALVTLVACGLMAWALGRRASTRSRAALFTAAALIALAAGGARLILDAHWPSDVVGGLAFGAGWLNLVVAVAERQIEPTGTDGALEAAGGGG